MIYSSTMLFISAYLILSCCIIDINLSQSITFSPSMLIMHLSTVLRAPISLYFGLTLLIAIINGFVLFRKSSSSSKILLLRLHACSWVILLNSYPDLYLDIFKVSYLITSFIILLASLLHWFHVFEMTISFYFM